MEHFDNLKTLVGAAGPGYWVYRDGAYSKREGDVTDDMIHAHLANEQPIGINVASEARKSRFIIFDIDDHDGDVDPSIMLSRAGAIAGALHAHGAPFFAVRSGGGRGIHLWVVLERTFSSDIIRDKAKKVLTDATTILQNIWPEESFDVGTGGLKPGGVHQIEIFPKGAAAQYNVALPLSRQSSPLAVTDIDENGFARLEPADTFEIEMAKARKSGPKKGEKRGSTPPDYDAAFDAFIRAYDVDDYHKWGAAALCLIAAFERNDGVRSDWARARWVEWSKTSTAFKRGDEKHWDECGRPQYSPITFWLTARDNGYSGKLPFNTTEERRLTAISFLDDVRLLRDDVGTAFAQVGPRQFMPVKSEAFSHRIILGLHREKGLMPDDTAVRAVQNYAAALASETSCEDVWLRFGRLGDVRYLFLADDDCTVIEIDKNGWRVNDDAPVVFRKGDGLPMEMPQRGSLDEFTEFLNVSDDEMPFLLAWMVTALFNPGGICPIALLDGPAGSGKSSALRTIIETIDPKSGAQAGEPKSEDDLFAAAYMAATVSGDNFSSIAKISDPLCRLSTGGGVRKRKLYTDLDSVSMSAQRPILIAGIDPTFYAADLSERIVRVSLRRPDEYKDDMQFDAELRDKRARFTGAILDLVSLCLREAQSVDYKGSRFATYVQVGEVIAQRLGFAAGWFIEAAAEKAEGEKQELEHSDSVFEFITRQVQTSGDDRCHKANSKQLWEEMEQQIELGHIKVPRNDVPHNPRQMASRIKRAEPLLMQNGVTVSQDSRRVYTFTLSPDVCDIDALVASMEKAPPPF